MKDRIPTYPGRVTLTPVPGQANTYDLVRADEPAQEGTALNKANLLEDDTAASIHSLLSGYTAPQTPNMALSLLAIAVGARAKVELFSYVGTGVAGPSTKNKLSFSFEPKAIVFSSGAPENSVGGLVWVRGENSEYTYLGWRNDTELIKYGDNLLSWGTKEIQWWSPTSGDNNTYYPYYQLNKLNKTYYGLAIG